MKFKCKDCGKIYDVKPDYCECGNDTFLTMRTKAERDAMLSSSSKMEYRREEKGEKENPLNIILFLVLVACLAFFVVNKTSSIQSKAPVDDYLTNIREEMLSDFDPQGLTVSASCVISFKISETGKVYEKRIIQSTKNRPLEEKIENMFNYTNQFAPPPLAYKDKPIKIEFGCSANEREVSCYTKNLLK